MRLRPLLLGHRGLRTHSVRENTFAAFDLALQHGCDGFEFDVRLTADDRAVVCHDANWAGLTIARSTAAELRVLPRLEDVLDRYDGRAFLDIELKVQGLKNRLFSAIAEHSRERGYVVSSFLPDILLDLRACSKSVPLGIICETRQQLARWRKLPVRYVIAKQSLVTPELIHDVHSAAKKLFSWTVNKKESMTRLAGWGIDGIISDKPDLLAATLRPPEKEAFHAHVDEQRHNR
jgi:glycerophosphoryl diester phosphodiesterase